jgi:glutamate carboxypeptidase
MNDIVAYLEKDLASHLQLLEQMVSMESPSFDKDLVDRFARFTGDRFAELGGAVELVPSERFGDHLRVRFKGRRERQILLLGHTDTVFPRDEIRKRPFTIRDGKATGPGVFDMKSGILLMRMAMDALLRVRGGTANSIAVFLGSDEEVGSTSSRQLIENEARKSAAVLVLEPSLPGGAVKTARKGVGHFTIKAIGRAAHAGIDPGKGVNAIAEISHQVLRLQEMTEASRGTTVTVGVIEGGTRSNVVPAEAGVEVDVRIKSIDEAERIVKAIKGLNPYLTGARLQIRGSINRPPMERTSETERLFGIARGIAATMGIDLQEGATGGASDGNFTAALGIPTLDGLGPPGDGAHSVDEFVDVDSLPGRAALLAGLIEAL